MNTEAVPAVLLAAGLSRRLGRPKALVSVNGRTLVEWAHERLLAANCTPVVVVNTDIESESKALLPNAHIVVNPQPDLGRTGSLQLGLRTLVEVLGYEIQRLVMVPVDRPCWNVPLLKALLEHEGNVAPAHDGRRGHPVVLEGEGLATVSQAQQDTPLRDLVHFAPLSVFAPWLNMNIDTPEDVDQLLAEGEHLSSCFSESEGI